MDIDAYAAAIALAELLNQTGEPAYAASSAPLNESVPQSLRALEGIGLAKYTPGAEDEFIIVDLSKEDYFDPIVRNGKVIEVIDHHSGQEEYWQDRTDIKVDLEFIGASCTQVFERWLAGSKLSKMKPGIAKLLAAGILDNTLNLTADVTTERDKQAYKELMRIGGLPEDFPAQYFSECQAAINQNFEQALRNDTKTMEEAPLLPHVLGQITVWDARSYAADKKSNIEAALKSLGDDWALNLISIKEGKSYLVTTSPEAQTKLNHLLGIEFSDGVAALDRLWLRKELLKLALETA